MSLQQAKLDQYARIKQYVEEQKGGTLVSKEYISIRLKMNIICAQGHEFSIRPDGLLRESPMWCKQCYLDERPPNRPPRTTLEDAIAIATEKGGKCLSTTYKTSKTLLEWECGGNEAGECHIW